MDASFNKTDAAFCPQEIYISLSPALAMLVLGLNPNEVKRRIIIFKGAPLVGDDILVFKRVNPNLVFLKNLTQMMV